ncbi:FimV/HubP family polar landmark protein [Psychromonas arctica]|uniref:FimV/HubP family polar landmark protein n=1 Tax=Psychromonas arctica TaxID=168275 RepID=UPI002FD51C36
MNRMFLAVVSCLPLLLTAHNVQSVELVGPNEEPQSIQSLNSVASSNSTSSSSVSRYGPVSVNETLWSISNKLRPNTDVSVYQTLVAIYKANPTAFRNGDINRIIVASVIDVPSLSFISQQTNAEAFRLLRITNNPAPTKAPTQTSPAVIEKQEAPAEVTQTAEPEQTKSTKEAVQVNNEQLQKLEAEYALLNEQLIAATESNQRLKLKLQPLSDQIHTLSEQVEQDINVQIELQALIDQYKAEIDAFEEPPFSGPGLLNNILSSITGSASTLLLTILSPLLLLTALFLLILRIKSKRELALKEQELAESTSIMDEEENEFDSLFAAEIGTEEVLTEDELSDAEEEDALTIIEEELSNNNVLPETSGLEADLIEGEDDSSNNDAIDMDALLNDEGEITELSESDLTLDEDISQNDLDLAAQWESELAELEDKGEDQVDLDEFQFDTQEDAPLEPIQLDDVETESVEQDLSIEEDSTPEAIPEVEEILEESSTDAVSESEEVATESTDIDDILSAEQSEIENDVSPEAIPEVEELLEESSEEAVSESEKVATKSTDIDDILSAEQSEIENDVSLEAIPEVEEILEESSEEAVSENEEMGTESADIDDINDIQSAENMHIEEDNAPEAIPEVEELLEDNSVEAVSESEEMGTESADIDDILSAENTHIEEDSAPEAIPEVEELLEESSVAAVSESEEMGTESTDIDDILSTEHSDMEEDDVSVPESAEDIENPLTPESDQEKEVSKDEDEFDFNDPDSLAKQLSNNAFNEETELPKFDKTDDKGFIDIDALLANEEGLDVGEEEFDLDFGLDEFPDVVESFAEFDTDADGVAAQLDLARAYLEIDEKEGAKTILTQLMETAPEDKLKEVKKLYDRIS